MTLPGHKTAGGDSRTTPVEIAQFVHAFFDMRLGIDPCWNPASPVRARCVVQLPDNGLTIDWNVHRTAFVNGPWSDLTPWVEKCRESFLIGGCESLFLARTESATEWARLLLSTRCAHVDLHKRYCFPVDGKPGTTDTRPATISYYGDRVQRFASVFRAIGTVYGRPL